MVLEGQGECPRCGFEQVEYFDQYCGCKYSCRNCDFRVDSYRVYRFYLIFERFRSNLAGLF